MSIGQYAKLVSIRVYSVWRKDILFCQLCGEEFIEQRDILMVTFLSEIGNKMLKWSEQIHCCTAWGNDCNSLVDNRSTHASHCQYPILILTISLHFVNKLLGPLKYNRSLTKTEKFYIYRKALKEGLWSVRELKGLMLPNCPFIWKHIHVCLCLGIYKQCHINDSWCII